MPETDLLILLITKTLSKYFVLHKELNDTLGFYFHLCAGMPIGRHALARLAVLMTSDFTDTTSDGWPTMRRHR
jgi:glutaminase